MSTEEPSLASEGMYSKFVDDTESQLEGLYGNMLNSGSTQRTGKRVTVHRPYQVATACLSAFCLILLMALVATSVHNKTHSAASIGQNDISQNLSYSSSAQKQKACSDVTILIAEQKRLEKNNSDLIKEIKQLKTKIEELEATPSPPLLQCSENWLHFNGSCYFISVYSQSWRESQNYCKKNGGHLAIIHTAEEQTFLWNLLPRGHWNAYWFGISDDKVEGDWYWVDGTKLIGGFWEVGEPNNHIDEDCGYIVKTEVLTRVPTKSWYDAPCFMSLPWICEKAATTS